MEYIDRIQDYLQQEIESYNQEKADEFETIDAFEEDRERREWNG